MSLDKLQKTSPLYFKINTEQISQILTCAICLNQASFPTLTPCGHLFCANCIATYFATTTKCPLCRAELTPPFTCRNIPVEKIIDLIFTAPRLQDPTIKFKSPFNNEIIPEKLSKINTELPSSPFPKLIKTEQKPNENIFDNPKMAIENKENQETCEPMEEVWGIGENHINHNQKRKTIGCIVM